MDDYNIKVKCIASIPTYEDRRRRELMHMPDTFTKGKDYMCRVSRKTHGEVLETMNEQKIKHTIAHGDNKEEWVKSEFFKTHFVVDMDNIAAPND